MLSQREGEDVIPSDPASERRLSKNIGRDSGAQQKPPYDNLMKSPKAYPEIKAAHA
jgi:hypothetical protein